MFVALRARDVVALTDYTGWSLYGAERSQPVATGGKWDGRENGSDLRKPLLWVATSCRRDRMVRRGSTVRVRQRALQKSNHQSGDARRTGFMSTTGVPSIASSGRTFNSRPTISSTVTGCNPSGFGRSGDRVAKTPVSGTLVSPRGCVFKTSRRDSCNQVMTISSSPASIRSSPSWTNGASSIHASGAPSLP
jgi:hypothetical protein